jgi:hypothetical protein
VREVKIDDWKVLPSASLTRYKISSISYPANLLPILTLPVSEERRDDGFVLNTQVFGKPIGSSELTPAVTITWVIPILQTKGANQAPLVIFLFPGLKGLVLHFFRHRTIL